MTMRPALIVFLLLTTSTSFATVTVYSDKTSFLNDTSATNLTLPTPTDMKLYPCMNYNWGCDDQLLLPSSSGDVKVTLPQSKPSNLFKGLLHPIGLGYNIGNLSPSNGNEVAFTGNGDDDVLIEFPTAINSIGFDIITNFSANETITLKDENGIIVAIITDDHLDTLPNHKEFIGISSTIPFKSMYIDNSGGANQNEAISAIFIGDASSNTPSQCAAQIVSLQSQVSALNAQVTALQAQNAQLTSQVSMLQAQNTALQNQLNQVSSSIALVQSNLGITIPGPDVASQVSNLINAIINLNPGRKQGIITQFP